MNSSTAYRRWVSGTVTAAALLSAVGGGSVRAAVIRPLPTESVMNAGLSVQGHADLKVTPDIGHLTVGVTTQALHEEDAAAQNAKISTAVLAALRDAGVADKDIVTSGYDTQPQYNYQVSPQVLTGYQVSNTVEVTVRDLRHAGSLIDKVTAAGATNVSGLSFDLADRAAAEQQALKLAVKNAMGKADAMAQAAGVARGPLLSLSEGTPTMVQPLFVSHGLLAAKAAEPTTPIESSEITVSADVTAVYDISQ